MDTPTLASRLRSRRLELGLTQQELAEKAKTSQACVQKCENSKSLRPRNVADYAAALNTTVEYLMMGILVNAPKDTDSDAERLDKVVAMARAYGVVPKEREVFRAPDEGGVSEVHTFSTEPSP